MKVITPAEIKSIATSVAKSVEQKVSTKPVKDGSKYVTNTLDALAVSARAGIEKRLSPNEVLAKHDEFLNILPYDLGVRSFIKNSSDDAKALKDIDTLLGLFDGQVSTTIKLDEKILKHFGRGKIIPENISKDLEIVRKSGNLIDNYVPVFKSKEEAMRQAKMGDVFQIAGEKGVSIRNKSSEIEQLSMAREDYFKLFPPVERFAHVQGTYGNCYEVTALNSMMERPETRENLLRCFDTLSEKGVTRIKFPNSNFTNGVVVDTKEIALNGDYYSKGCDGFKYLEEALGKEYERAFVDYQAKELMKQGKDSSVATLLSLYNKGKGIELTKYCGGKEDIPLATVLRQGGEASIPWSILGLKNNGAVELVSGSVKEARVKKMIDDTGWMDKYLKDDLISDENKFAELLWSPEFFKNHLVEAAVCDKGTYSTLQSGHSYKLSAVLDKKGKVDSYLIKDPHYLFEKPITFDDIFNEIDTIIFTKI